MPQVGYNGLAIASLVLGIVWLYFIGSVLAIVFGHIALRQIRGTGQSGRRLAVVGIVLGWCWIGAFILTWMFLSVARQG